MRIAIKKEASLLGIFALLVLPAFAADARASTAGAVSAPQCTAVMKAGATAAGIVRTTQGTRDARLNATFDFSLARDGAIRMVVRTGELEVEKKVYPDGHLQAAVRSGDDVVSLTLAQSVLEVERNNRQHRVSPRASSDDEWVRINELMAGSKAVRLLRLLAQTADAGSREVAPGHAALLSTDALFGVLSGDVAAAQRVGRRLAAIHAAGIRPVVVRQEFLECYRKYSEAVNQAMTEFGQCYMDPLWFDPYGYLCSFEWLLKVESAWFQFIACSGLPLRLE